MKIYQITVIVAVMTSLLGCKPAPAKQDEVVNVTMPNGMVVRNVPKGTSKAQILKKLEAAGYNASEMPILGPPLPQADSPDFVRMAPDGTYVNGTPRMAPDGTYVSGTPRMAPDGTYVGGSPRMAPDGTYVSGTPRMAPDGTYVGGSPRMAPDGTYVGTGE